MLNISGGGRNTLLLLYIQFNKKLNNMKNISRIFFSILLLQCLCNSLSFAQFQFESHLGGNVSMRYTTYSENRSVNMGKTAPILGIQAKILPIYQFSPKFGLELGLSFNQYGFSQYNPNTERRSSFWFNYIGIPIAGRWQINKTFQAYLGLNGAYLIAKDVSTEMNRFTLIAETGCRWNYKNFILSLSYSNHITPYYHFIFITEKINQRFHALSFAVGYRFWD